MFDVRFVICLPVILKHAQKYTFLQKSASFSNNFFPLRPIFANSLKNFHNRRFPTDYENSGKFDSLFHIQRQEHFCESGEEVIGFGRGEAQGGEQADGVCAGYSGEDFFFV
jgi:hypothetical protein